METTTVNQESPFLRGGGEMGERTRHYNWAQTTLGTPDQWPQSLRTTVGIVLHSAFPMFLFWGDELTCFYNDAYRPSLGIEGRHPALGKPGREVWADIWGFMGPLIEQVMATGEPIWFEDQLVPIYRNGQLEDVYWTFSYSAAYGDEGQISGILVTCTETTKQVNTVNQLRLSEQRFQNLVREASVGIIVLGGEEMKVNVVNEAYARLIGRRCDALLGKPLFSIIPESEAVFRPILNNVRLSGESLYLYGQSYLVYVNGAEKKGFLDLVYQPYREHDGTITGVMVICQDVTERKLAEEELVRFKYMAENASDAFILMREDGTFAYLNQLALDRWGYTAAEALTLRVPDVDPIYNDAVFAAAFAQAQLGEIPPFETLHQHKDGTTYPVEVNMGGLLLNDQPHLFAVARDITDRKQAEQALRASENLFRNVANSSPTGLWLSDEAGGLVYLNNTLVEWTGMTYANLLGPGWANAIIEEDRQRSIDVFVAAITSRTHYDVLFRIRKRKGDSMWCRAAGDPYYNEVGVYAGYAGFCMDIDEQVKARQIIEGNEVKLRGIVENASFPIGVFVGPELQIQIVNQRLIDMWGKGPDLVGKRVGEVLPEFKKQHILAQIDAVYASGVPFHVKNQPVYLEHEDGLQSGYYNYSFTPLFDTAGQMYGVMKTGADVTDLNLAKQQVEEAGAALRGAIEMAQLGTWSIDVATNGLTYSDRLIEWFGYDPAAQPYSEVIPIILETDRERVETAVAWALNPASDGVYNEIYTVIHPQTGQRRILHAQGKTVVDATGKAFRMNGTAQDITIQRELQLALENEVQQRTRQLQESVRDLERSNENLQQFAYVASHDLQEPLRKIQTFGDLLISQHGDQLGHGIDFLQRMQTSAGRMSTLIRDLLTYSRISTRQETSTMVVLPEVMQTVLTDLDLIIQETGATLTIAPLPTIRGDESQLGQLFQNLLSNALKFSRVTTDGLSVRPVVQIRYRRLAATDLPGSVKPARPAAAYHQIDVTDNGIGFEEKYALRIFQVFQRLHGKGEFAGTGIGLAICEKVVTNHGGAIAAQSQPGQGATFSVYLPS